MRRMYSRYLNDNRTQSDDGDDENDYNNDNYYSDDDDDDDDQIIPMSAQRRRRRIRSPSRSPDTEPFLVAADADDSVTTTTTTETTTTISTARPPPPPSSQSLSQSLSQSSQSSSSSSSSSDTISERNTNSSSSGIGIDDHELDDHELMFQRRLNDFITGRKAATGDGDSGDGGDGGPMAPLFAYDHPSSHDGNHHNYMQVQDLNTMLEIAECDGGENSSPFYAHSNLLIPDNSCYSSKKGRNINIVIRARKHGSSERTPVISDATMSGGDNPRRPLEYFSTMLTSLLNRSVQSASSLERALTLIDQHRLHRQQEQERQRRILNRRHVPGTYNDDTDDDSDETTYMPLSLTSSSRRTTAADDSGGTDDTEQASSSPTSPALNQQLEDARPGFNICEIVVKNPREGFTNPFCAGLLWISCKSPNIGSTSKYDLKGDMTLEAYRARHGFNKRGFLERGGGQGHGAESGIEDRDPVLMFTLGENEISRIFKLPHPRFGRYIHVKLLVSTSPGSHQEENIDISYIGFRGFTGSYTSSCGELM